MNYEALLLENKHLNIKELNLSEVSDLKGLYIDGNIAINSKLNTVEKSCILAEELGHHYTSTGNILDLSDVRNRKQEFKARMWAYDKQIGLLGLIKAYQHGCQGRTELAKFLEVTEEFLQEAIECYTSKYGAFTVIDTYAVVFIPNLSIIELL